LAGNAPYRGTSAARRFIARHVRRRQLLVTSLAGSAVAATIIVPGLPNLGIAVYISSTLPFALFP
jgi:hypothetical protein